MKYVLGLVLLASLGCKEIPKPGAVAEGDSSEPVAESGGVTPMTSAPLATAPVSGAESVQGSGGSAAGQIMKDKARSVGGSSSVSQLPQMDAE